MELKARQLPHPKNPKSHRLAEFISASPKRWKTISLLNLRTLPSGRFRNKLGKTVLFGGASIEGCFWHRALSPGRYWNKFIKTVYF